MEGRSLILLYLEWWYVYGYRRLFLYLKMINIFIFDLFSVKICVKTLFAPWKRDEISYEGLTIQQKFHVWTLNLASRIVGFLVKSGTIISYFILSIIMNIAAAALVVVYPLIPFVAIYSIVLGVRIIF